MGLFDSILGSAGGEHADVTNLATKLGIETETADKGIAALALAHQQPGDTVGLASTTSGIDASVLGKIVEQIGGEGSLSDYARMIAADPHATGRLLGLDRDGDGSVMDDIGALAKRYFGKS